MASEYNIKGTVTFEEYLECRKILAAKRRPWIRAIIISYGAGILIYATAFSVSKPDVTFILIGALLVLYGIVISPILFRYRVRRNWERYPMIKRDFDVTVSEKGLETADDKGNPSHADWDSFFRFRESECFVSTGLAQNRGPAKQQSPHW